MNPRKATRWHAAVALFVLTSLLFGASCSKNSNAETPTVDLNVDVKVPFHFVAYGDARFHDPRDTVAANPVARVTLVKAIADANPSFICFTGDLVYKGYDPRDWRVWDSETSPWQEKKIPVYPAIGNHELLGPDRIALFNYFERFPELKNSRYYSVRAANIVIFVLDSSLGEISGPQGKWLADKLDHVPADVDFVFLALHHPPYTSSTEEMMGAEGHEARGQEKELGKMLEERQAHAAYRAVVFSGHVHNYERHEHGGVTYFVSGGAGAHAYPIHRAPDDPFQSREINYHYLLVEVDHQKLKVTMNRVDLTTGKAVWSQPDSVVISTPTAAAASQAPGH